jgi:hypothetical protein
VRTNTYTHTHTHTQHQDTNGALQSSKSDGADSGGRRREGDRGGDTLYVASSWASPAASRDVSRGDFDWVEVEEVDAFLLDAEQVSAVSPGMCSPSWGGGEKGGGGRERERESPDSGHVTDLHSVVSKFVVVCVCVCV